MKHVFKRWAWRKEVNYGIAVCAVCGEHFFVGNYEGCPGSRKTEHDHRLYSGLVCCPACVAELYG